MFRFFCASLPLMLSVGIATAIYYYFSNQVERRKNRPHTRKEVQPSTAFTDSIVNDLCGICLGDIRSKDQDIVRLECNHGFHLLCIDGILTGLCPQKLCPFCRRVINRMSTVHNR